VGFFLFGRKSYSSMDTLDLKKMYGIEELLSAETADKV